MIHFRTRKYGSHMNSSYFLKDGPNIGDLSRFMTGDRVTIMWPCNAEKRDALETLDPRVIGQDFYVPDAYKPDNDMTIFTPCIVVERTHFLSRRHGDIGDLRDAGLSITLEAANGYVEDMLLWIMLGECPAWAGETE